MLKTGIQWEDLPQEMGCGSGMTCWRRLRDWQRAGVFDRLQALILARLEGAGALDWSRAVMDASLVRAKGTERTFAHLNQMRRLAVRYEKRADICIAFLTLGCALLAFRHLAQSCSKL